MYAVLCNPAIISTFYGVGGPRQCNSWSCCRKFLVSLCHGTVKMSAKQIRAEKRSLSAAGVVSCARHRHRFVMGLLCKALPFRIVIYGYSFWELIQMMIAIKWHSWKSYWILRKCYLSHPEHPYIAEPHCTLLWKIRTPVRLQTLFETIFFSSRLPIILYLGPLSKWLAEVHWRIIQWNQHQNLFFSPGVPISLCSPSLRISPRLFPPSLCAARALPEGRLLSDLMFRTAVVPGSRDRDRGEVLSIFLHWAKPNYQRC